MVEVIRFLKRAEHLTPDEFRDWWLIRHAEDTLPGKPAAESDWDGCAEQWFASQADFEAVYGRSTPNPTRADTLRHVSRFERLVVREHEIAVEGGDGP